jgi:L-alanine-DL-glutamate epimerase-like enolase superfamily enzyme
MLWTRRELFQIAAAQILPGLAPPITAVQVFPAPYPVSDRFKPLAGETRASILIKITCESGAVGWGQSVPIPTWSYETVESVVSTINNYLMPVLIGGNPFDIAGAHRAMDRAIAPSFSTGMPIAKAGIDLALHDLAGRLRGQNMPERWGRQSSPKLTLSWTVNTRNLAEVESLTDAGIRLGYRNFNVRLGPDPRYDLEMCRVVKRMAPQCFLWGDANGSYDLASALWVAPRLADLGMSVLEQPLPANRLSGYRELKQQAALPVLMDEGVVSSTDLIEFIRLDMLDGVAMKLARTGGLQEARKQIETLRDAGLLCLGSGLTDPDVSLAATLQLYGAYQLELPAALDGPQFLTGTYLKQPLEVQNGELAVPLGPGLGVEIDEAKVRTGMAQSTSGPLSQP